MLIKKGIKRPGKGKQQPPTKWNSSTITKILSLQKYFGDILNFKTYSKSYKNKKRIDNDRENWVVFKIIIPTRQKSYTRNNRTANGHIEEIRYILGYII